MIEININQEEFKKLVLEQIEKNLKEIDSERVFWNMSDLIRNTGMSKSNILDKFFYDPDFPKYRPGREWLFPVVETKAFLLNWLRKQPRI
ncbi:group-specific protein [Jeotgalibacillus soli]|uniref:Group-specific protein n=1 Tax=Jeotgalibacillus soli TaxID=889306 RepID=A0A0C2V7U3_9BACL|nr:group-specific protein [Jeotgalibacillus soli]KIL45012.1 hypothetical protein KP78_25560 [Jeotgalibacillus soli]